MSVLPPTISLLLQCLSACGHVTPANVSHSRAECMCMRHDLIIINYVVQSSSDCKLLPLPIFRGIAGQRAQPTRKRTRAQAALHESDAKDSSDREAHSSDQEDDVGNQTEEEAEGASEVDDEKGSPASTTSSDTQPSEPASKPVRKRGRPRQRGAAGQQVSMAQQLVEMHVLTFAHLYSPRARRLRTGFL